MNQGLPPFYDEHTEILIVGSAPSQQSLVAQQYYANKGNQFWRVLFQALGVRDPQKYTERLRILKAYGIGLWDVYGSFHRTGSMDHQFQETTINDFSSLLADAPIKKIIANGKKAAEEIQIHRLFTDLTVINCLSTSGANNGRMTERLSEWQQALSINFALYYGSDAWLQAASFHLRYQVFVEEQNIPPHWEFDEIDAQQPNYFVLFERTIPIATIRYQAYSHDTIQPDRFCVAKTHRKLGLGKQLLQRFEEQALKDGYHYALLSAETTAIAFYEKLAYQRISEPFEEDGILCVTMRKRLTK
jgi:hypoxanthine-DNA glycosylase